MFACRVLEDADPMDPQLVVNCISILMLFCKDRALSHCGTCYSCTKYDQVDQALSHCGTCYSCTKYDQV